MEKSEKMSVFAGWPVLGLKDRVKRLATSNRGFYLLADSLSKGAVISSYGQPEERTPDIITPGVHTLVLALPETFIMGVYLRKLLSLTPESLKTVSPKIQSIITGLVENLNPSEFERCADPEGVQKALTLEELALIGGPEGVFGVAHALVIAAVAKRLLTKATEKRDFDATIESIIGTF